MGHLSVPGAEGAYGLGMWVRGDAMRGVCTDGAGSKIVPITFTGFFIQDFAKLGSGAFLNCSMNCCWI